MAGLLAMPGSYGFLAADENGTPAGFILCRVAADEAEILTLMVVPALRRQGFARHLLRAGQKQAARQGAATIFLEVASNNKAAKMLYESNGFVEVGRRARYYPNGSDALVLQAILS